MARSFLTAINLNRNELQNAAVQNLGTAPTAPAPVKGQVYFNNTGGDNTLYWYDGSVWVSARGGLLFGASTAVLSFGQAKADGVAGTMARSDHTHGSPAHETAAHSTIPLSSLQSPFSAASSDVIFGSAKVDGVSNSASRADHTHGNPTHVNADHSAINLNALAAPTADVSMNGFKLTNVGAPVSGSDAANKTYVDNSTAGLTWKTAVRLTSIPGYNGTLSGLTAIDGVTPVGGDRILLKDQNTPNQNGIWIAAAGAWTRATDADSSAELVDAAVFVMEGTTNADTAWVCATNAPIVVGTTGLTWVQFAGGGTIVAGSGLAQSGNAFNVGATNPSIVVAADDISVAFQGSGGNFGTNYSVARSDHVHTGVYPPVARLISTTLPLTGGGDLSADRTLAINNFGSAAAGAVPASGGGTVNFLRADGTWVVPPVDTTTGDARYGRKFTLATIGGALSQLVNHALNTRNVIVNVFRTATPWDTVECDVERTDANNVTLRFAVAPATNEYTCVVMG